MGQHSLVVEDGPTDGGPSQPTGYRLGRYWLLPCSPLLSFQRCPWSNDQVRQRLSDLGRSQRLQLRTSYSLIAAEWLVNSRLLTYQSTSPSDVSPLTPNHVLYGRVAGELVPLSRCVWRRQLATTSTVTPSHASGPFLALLDEGMGAVPRLTSAAVELAT